MRSRRASAQRSTTSYRSITLGSALVITQCPVGCPTWWWNAYTTTPVRMSSSDVSQLTVSMTSITSAPPTINTRRRPGLMPTGASSVSNIRAAIVGRITSATNSDELSVMIRVNGRYFMNSPMIPGQNVMGKNAASVVAVDAMMGTATSPVAYFAARTRSNRFSRKR